MTNTRRQFLTLAAAASVAGFTKLNAAFENSAFQLTSPGKNIVPDSLPAQKNETLPVPPPEVKPANLILPKGLRKGSKIAITAPASPTSMGEIAKCVSILKKNGFKVEIGKTITARNGKFRYLSDSDEERAKEFMEFASRDDIDCILSGRGGYGVMRILPFIDFNVLREKPKIIIGFSDITALVNATYEKSKIVSFHGPVATASWSKLSTDSFLNILSAKEKFIPLKMSFPKVDIVKEGVVSGKLVGGNLSIVSGTLGTPYEIDTKDSLLFLEEVSEEPYKIDRMLTQLWLGGKLQQCNGIIFGYFKNLTARKNFWPVISFTVKQIIESRVKPLGIPSVIGLPIGHHEDNITLPIGIKAEINTKLKNLTILEPATIF